MNHHPIGIFDSGIGGTSVWKEIAAMMPLEDTLYLADSRNAPYGERTGDEIIALSVKNTEWLLSKQCKIIVVACNTATTNAIAYLRDHYPLPFIGIEPAIKPAALHSQTGTVGVLATKGTLASRLFSTTSKNHASHIRIVEQEGAGLVSLIESGRMDSVETRELLKKYLLPMLDANMDHLVLGCTHFPYLMPLLREFLPDHIKIIDCGEAVARQTFKLVRDSEQLSDQGRPGRHTFFTNADPGVLNDILDSLPGIKEVSYLDF